MSAQRFQDGSGNIVTVEVTDLVSGQCVGVRPATSHPVGVGTTPNPVQKAVATILGVNSDMAHGDVIVTKADGTKSKVTAATFAGYKKIDG